MEWEEFIAQLEKMREDNKADLVIWTAHNQQVVAVNYEDKQGA